MQLFSINHLKPQLCADPSHRVQVLFVDSRIDLSPEVSERYVKKTDDNRHNTVWHGVGSLVAREAYKM